jgi:predicted amidohydrolase YtcJ
MNKYKKAFINGKIYTVNPETEWAEAIVTANNKIIFVGSNEQAQLHIDVFTEVIDLGGKLVLPGFIDSHAHIVIGGEFLLNVDLTEVDSPDLFSEMIRDIALIKKERWVIGGSWNHHNWKDSELPRKEWIDKDTKSTPVFVNRMDYHMALANSIALKLAGITSETPNPHGGEIIKDKNGEPTGILIDKAMDLVFNVIPKSSDEEYASAVNAAMKLARENGVTSIHDISYNHHFQALQKAERENRLTSRIYSRLLLKKHESFSNIEIEYSFGSDILKIGSMKAFADGSLGSESAYMFEPYLANPDNYGLPMEELTNGKMKEMIIESDKKKLQCSIHTIGDRAVSELLDIVEVLVAENSCWDRRFRIEHAQTIRPEDIKRCADLGVIISGQPYHLYDDGCWAEGVIGKDRLKQTYAFKSMLNAGVKLCFGSDWSVSTINPIKGIHVAVTRESSDGKNPNGLIPEEKLTVEEAIKCYTINAAFAAFQEKTVGSLEVGKLADFVVLSDNIFNIPSRSIKDVKVLQTVFNGDIVYS